MANRDHSLEDGIVQAAYSEFLTYGFQKPRFTRSLTKPVSPRGHSTQGTRIKTHCLAVCFRIF